MSSRAAVCVLILGVIWTPVQPPDEGPPIRLAQQTVTVPTPPPGLPSTLPQTQAFTACVMNCDTASGVCQGSCSVNNSPALIATLAGGPRPDAHALTQCYLNCTSQQLSCKQACTPPH